jgi:hypothetical protein
MALPFTLRNVLKQKKNYGNFNISVENSRNAWCTKSGFKLEGEC